MAEKNRYQGPRPRASDLQISSQIPNFEPKNAEEALYAGTKYYNNPKTGELTQLRQVDSKKRQGKYPLSHGNTEKVSSRKSNRGNYRAYKKEASLNEQMYIDAFGEQTGKNLYKEEKAAQKSLKLQQKPGLDIDHIDSLADGGPDASRNQRLMDSLQNQKEGARKLPDFKKRMLGIEGGVKAYPKLHGPWAAPEMVKNIINGPDNPIEFAEVWYKKVKSSVKDKGLKIGGGLIAAATITPTVKAAEQARQEVVAGNYGAAAGTIGKDLAIQQTGGELAARGLKLANKVVTSKLNPIVGKKIARTALKIVGKQVLKKGAALATGPAAPMLIAGMLVFDAYQAADALSGGALTQFFKTKQTGGRSGASMRINN